VSFILVQVRNYSQEDEKYATWAPQMTPDYVGITPTPPDFPYLALYMQLGDKMQSEGILRQQRTAKRQVLHPVAVAR
jgi:hypothetical protein